MESKMDTKLIQDLTTNKKFLLNFVKEWNESRLDMFALSQPNEKMQFSGVMRFFFQDSGQKATTKCIRVTSDQSVADIMPTLIDKFCPDLKMLSMPNYELYEIHGTGDVRKLNPKQRPLLVQLHWHNDDREGRFVLKNAEVKIQPVKFFEINQDEGQLKRRLSRREKKDLKKKRKEELARQNKKNQDKLLADKVYRELPESSLTRTISNPEAVMRRRRQQKLEKRMKEFQNKGGPQTGGILKIFAESLKPEIPYKTILASVKDNADVITKAALEKFLLPDENPIYFCIVMAIIAPGEANNPGNVKERIIRSSDCPLAIQNSWPRSKGVITFHLRRKDDAPENTSKIPKDDKKAKGRNQSSSQPPSQQPKPPPATRGPPPPLEQKLDYDIMPYFLELTPEGKEISYKPKLYYIRAHETVIGSSRNPSPGVQYLQLFSPKILASHCSIVNEDGCVSIIPHGPDADVRVSGKRIFDTTILSNGNVVQFGGLHTFRFCNPLDPAHSEKSSIASEHGIPPYRPPTSPGMGSPPMSPISPELKEKILNEQIGAGVDDDLDADVAETTFGVDGGIETEKIPRHIYSARSAENLLDEETVVLRQNFRNSFKKHRQSAPNLLDRNLNEENLLPATLTFLENGKDAFFATVISEVNGAAVNFKLAPTYTLYLVARHVYSPAYRPGLNPVDRSKVITSTTKRIATSVQQTIQENDCLAGGLAFWMANASELLHFYRQDMDLGPLTQSAQAILAQSIQESFALLVNAMEDELALALPAFLDPSEEVDIHEHDIDAILNDDVLERAESVELLNWNSDNDDRAFRMGPNGRPLSGEQWIRPAARIHQNGAPEMADVLYILSSAMSLLRRCRVNAALTIQLFSQLFHYINMWIFNRIVLEPDLRLCSRSWGHKLRLRLSFVEAWAERQGLELAADCHLARIVQAAYLLESSKDSHDDIVDISQQCFKLNSLQLRCLLQNYQQESGESRIPQDLVETIVAVAESTADELTISDGREVKLEEDVQLQLPFLLPEEGYSSDIIRGVPPGLQEFLEPLCDTGLCELSLNPSSMGLWTVYQEPYDIDENDDPNRDSQLVEELPIQRVTIDKGKSGLGLSICAAKGVHSDFPGIYIKAVIKGGLADQDGRLEGGDQILSVNESSLIDVTQTQAAKIMGKSGPVITLEIMKGAAFYHGLAKLVEDQPKSIGGHARESSVDSGKATKMQRSSSRDLVDQQPPPPEPLPKREEYHSRGNSYDAASSHAPPPLQPKPHQRGASFDSRDMYYRDDEIDMHAPPPLQPKPNQENGSFYNHDDPYQQESNLSSHHRYQETDLDQPEPNDPYEQRDVRHSRDNSYDSSSQKRAPPPTQPKPKKEAVPPPEPEPVREPEPQHNESDYDSDGNLMTVEEKSRRFRQLQRQREYEERLAKWEEERKRKEEEEEALKRQKEEEDAERQYEEEVNRRRAEEDARLEEERVREDERKKQEAERKREEERKQREEEEQRRADERRKAEERRREEEREREEQRRLAEERRAAEERAAEERRRVDERRREEDYLRRKEEERRRKEEEAEREAEEQRRKMEAYRAEEKRKREQEEEAKRRKEKLRLVEERKRKEAEEADERVRRREQVQRENEDRRRREYEESMARRQQEQDRARRAEEEKRREEEERKRQREYENRVSANNSYNNAHAQEELDDDIAGINDAIREAERIAAEMDLFMMEEEMKIEEGAKQKREKEKSQWEYQAKPAVQTKPAPSRTNNYGKPSEAPAKKPQPHYQPLSNTTSKPPPNTTYKPPTSITYKPYQKVDLVINTQPMKRSSSRENLLETNLDDIDTSSFLPPPPQDLLDEQDFNPVGNEETNIDSTDDEAELPPSKPAPTPSKPALPSSKSQVTSNVPVMPRYNAKSQFQRHEQERTHHDQHSRGFARAPPPAVRPKSFKPPSSTPATNAVKGEFKSRSENDYDRRRQTLDKDFDAPGNHRSSARKNSSEEEDAPPRPPPPKSVTPSPRHSKSPQFTYANGHQDFPRSYSFGKRNDAPTNNGTEGAGAETVDFKTKMRMFNKYNQ